MRYLRRVPVSKVSVVDDTLVQNRIDGPKVMRRLLCAPFWK